MAFYSDVIGTQESLAERFTARAAQWFSDLNERSIRRRIARTTYAELSALSDMELSDIGIVRAEIRRIAVEAASGEL